MPTERLSMRRIRGFFLHLKYAQGMRDRAAAVSPGPGSRGCVTGLLRCSLDLARQPSGTVWRGRVARFILAAAVSPGLGKATVGNCLARARGQVYSGRCRRNGTTTAWSCCGFPVRPWLCGRIGLCRIGR